MAVRRTVSGASAVQTALTVPLGHPSGALGREGVRLLAAIPLFAGLSHRHLRAVGERSKIVRFGAGRTIITEGTRGDAFFVLLEGVARIVSGTAGRTVKRLGPGTFFGELALLDGSPRSASVVAASPVVTARLSRTAFLDLVKTQPEIGIRIMEVLARRIREAEGNRGL